MLEFFSQYGSIFECLIGVVGFVILWFRTRVSRTQTFDSSTKEKINKLLDLILSDKNDKGGSDNG